MIGQASVGNDFVARTSQRILFRPDSVDPTVTNPFDVTIVDDNVPESTEYFEVHFTVDEQRNSGGYAFPSAIAPASA